MHLKVSERIFVRYFLVIIFMLEKFSEHKCYYIRGLSRVTPNESATDLFITSRI